MSGHTGKMTVDAIRARGPRIRLVCIQSGSKHVGFVIGREGDTFLTAGATRIMHPVYWTYARSYSLGYLLRVARVVSRGVPA